MKKWHTVIVLRWLCKCVLYLRLECWIMHVNQFQLSDHFSYLTASWFHHGWIGDSYCTHTCGPKYLDHGPVSYKLDNSVPPMHASLVSYSNTKDMYIRVVSVWLILLIWINLLIRAGELYIWDTVITVASRCQSLLVHTSDVSQNINITFMKAYQRPAY